MHYNGARFLPPQVAILWQAQRGLSLLKRKLRTTLPICSKQKKHHKLGQKVKHQKIKQKAFYDRTAKQLPPLSRDDTVRIENPGGWTTKSTVPQEVAPQSYTVRTPERHIIRRNRRSLLKTPKAPETVPDQDLSQAQAESNIDTHTDNLTNAFIPGETATRRSTRTIKKPE